MVLLLLVVVVLLGLVLTVMVEACSVPTASEAFSRRSLAAILGLSWGLLGALLGGLGALMGLFGGGGGGWEAS